MGKSYAQTILEIIEKLDIGLLIDQFERPHIRIPGRDTPNPLRSRAVKAWLTTLLYDTIQKTPGPQALATVLDVLEGKAFQVNEAYEAPENQGRPDDDENKSMTQRLTEYMVASNPYFYRDERREAYVFYNLEGYGGYQNRPVESSDVEDWLTSLMWDNEETVPNNETINNVRRSMKGKAYISERIKGPHTLYNRMASDMEGGIWIDMSNKQGQAIHINENRWRLEAPEKPLFRHYNHQLALPDPKKGGQVKEVLAFVNLKDRFHQILYLVTLICCFIPDIEHPVYNVFGPQGSGKSSLLRVAKALVDPSIIDLLIMNKKDEKELVKTIDDSYCVFFDNISYLTQDISDLLCKAVTGAGFSNRRLWTNNESVLRQFKRIIGLNGINIPAEQGDLLSRCVNLETPHLEDDERIPKELYDKKLKERLPYILHDVLDTVVKTLQIKPTVNLPELSRLGDFTIWGYAAAKALGYDPEDFLQAYKESMGGGSIDAVTTKPTGILVIEFLNRQEKMMWEGQPQSLWKEFYDLARETNMSTSQRSFPKGAQALSRALNKLSPDLRKLGYLYTTRRTGKARIIKLELLSKPESRNSALDKYLEDESGMDTVAGQHKKLLVTLSHLERGNGAPVTRLDLWELVKHWGWSEGWFDKLLKVLISDGAVYMPRPGYYGVVK